MCAGLAWSEIGATQALVYRILKYMYIYIYISYNPITYPDGTRPQKTIRIMALGDFHNSSVYGPSWFSTPYPETYNLKGLKP